MSYGCCREAVVRVIMGACCSGGMKTTDQKSLPKNQQAAANSIDEKQKDQCVNGPPGDAAISAATDTDRDAAAPSYQTGADHTTVSPDHVQLSIAEAQLAAVSAADKSQPSRDECEQNKPATEALFVAEPGDVVRSDVTTTTTREQQHVQVTRGQIILPNILRQSYDYLTIMPKLRSTFDITTVV